MNSSRNVLLSIIAILFLTVQMVWAAAPGSGVTGEKKGGHSREQQQQKGIATEAPVTEMELLAVEEAELIRKGNGKVKVTKKSSQPATNPLGIGAEPAIDHSFAAKQSARQQRLQKRAALKKARKSAKARIKHAREASVPAAPDAGGSIGIFLLLAFFIPPLSVLLWLGDATTEFWLNLLLSLFFFIPGIIHAIVVIMR